MGPVAADSPSNDLARKRVAEGAVRGLYALAGLPEPKVVWRPSPREGLRETLRRVPFPAPPLMPDRHRPSRPRPSMWPSEVINLLSLTAFTRVRQVTMDEQDQVSRLRLDAVNRAVEAELTRDARSDLALSAFSSAYTRGVGPAEGVAAVSDILAAVAQHAGWWWPLYDTAILCEQPVLVRFDDQNRLHCENSPALLYPDGWTVYAWHGTPVPAWVVECPDPYRILHEPNVEWRRCAIERYGWRNFADSPHVRLVDRRPDPGNPGCYLTLYRVPFSVNWPFAFDAALRSRWSDAAGASDEGLLVCTNGTVERDGQRHEFGLFVPATINNALEAAAWTYDLPAYVYAATVRRT